MAHGFERQALEAVLDEMLTTTVAVSAKRSSDQPSMLQWFSAPLTQQTNHPRAWKLDTPLAQIYEIPNLLSREECQQLIVAIDQGLQRSTVPQGSIDYRTSRTCHLRCKHAALAETLDRRFAALFGVEKSFSEPIQGQRYDPGQYFKEHTDWFAPGTDEFVTHASPGGQRTWTLMVYLNTVELGGETCFKHLGRCFTPVPGMALAWNNLEVDGRPNPFTLHEGNPVEQGSKWVITKWFRAEKGRNG